MDSNNRSNAPRQSLACPACEQVYSTFGGIVQHFETNQCRFISRHAFEIMGDKRMRFAKELQRRHHGLDPDTLRTAALQQGQENVDPPPNSEAARISQMNALRPIAENTLRPNPVLLDTRGQGTLTASGPNSGNFETRESISQFDSTDPGFNSKDYWDPFAQKYKCPHKFCGKVFPSEKGFLAHLSSQAHTSTSGKEYQCPRCKNWFKSRFSLADHIESPNLKKCWIKESQDHRVLVGQLSCGIVDVDGRNPDGSHKYVISKEVIQKFGKPEEVDEEELERRAQYERPTRYIPQTRSQNGSQRQVRGMNFKW